MTHHQTLKQNPFSLYDFIGYYIPGFILVASLVFVDYYVLENCCGIKGFLNDVTSINSDKDFKLTKLFHDATLYIIPLIIFPYILGHFCGILSATFIEKGYYVARHGYPGESLLDENRKKHETKLCISNILMFPIWFIYRPKIQSSPFNTEEVDFLKKSIYKIMEELELHEKRSKKIEKQWYGFLFIYHYVMESECPHLVKIYNYVCLYGFFEGVQRTVST